MKRVEFTVVAERNIGEIAEWIANRSPGGADRWFQTLQRTIASIRADPERFPLAPESPDFKLPVRNATFRMASRRVYRILFSLGHDSIRILYVRGPGQDRAKP